MLKKDSEVKWSKQAKQAFENIKQALVEAPVLMAPDYTKDFAIFSFASQDTIAAVLLQKNSDNLEHPISFFSKTLRDSELKYNIMEKQAYALVKALKFFRIYVLHSKVVAYVPNAAVKEILAQPDTEGKRGKWIAKVMEYDMEKWPTKLIKGQGLAKLLTESNCQVLNLHIMAEQSAQSVSTEYSNEQIYNRYAESDWYKDVVYFLLYLQCPLELNRSECRSLKLKAIKYVLRDQVLYWKDPGGILLKCLERYEIDSVIAEMHSGMCGGHKYWKATAFKILRAGYYWPTLFSDVFQQVRSCVECQKFAGKQKLQSLPLKPISVDGPFQQWGLDFIGEIHPPSSGQHKWILTATDFFTKWVEAIPTRRATEQVIITFIQENILSRFGCPRKLLTDNAPAFKSKRMVEFCHENNISLKQSTPYYPQGNGLAESSNKNIVSSIKKMLFDNKRSWDSKLKFALWADRVTIKKSIGTSPFQLVYGTDAIFPVHLINPVMKFVQEIDEEPDVIRRRMFQIVQLQQEREAIRDIAEKHQKRIKDRFDKKVKKDLFTVGDLVLRWDARKDEKGKHGKFDNLWIGPFSIMKILGNNTFVLQNLRGEEIMGPVNGRFLKLFYTE